MKKQNSNGFYGNEKYENDIEYQYSIKRHQWCHICGERIDLCVDKFMTLASIVFYNDNRAKFYFDEKKKRVISDRQGVVGKFCCLGCHGEICDLMTRINEKSKSRKK